MKASFLYDDYKPQYWYWEVFELVRKLALSAAMLLFSNTKGATQVSIGLILSIVLHLWYTHCDPYILGTSRGLVHVSYFMITVTFFIALLLKAQGVSGDDNTLGVILVVSNLLVAVAAGTEVCSGAVKEGEKQRHRHRLAMAHEANMQSQRHMKLSESFGKGQSPRLRPTSPRSQPLDVSQLTSSSFEQTNPLARQDSMSKKAMKDGIKL